MFALFKKEVSGFLSSLIGYLVMAVFLVLTGLFMWVFPDNTLDLGYANLDILFFIAPWVFLFLIPAITMRSLAEEKRAGTIELLLTKPLGDLQIILAKYLAGLLLVALSILPTMVYFWTVYQLGSPVGNIDLGGTLGSYVGLLLLGAGYVAIGIFASSLTDNQIVAFILAVFICFFLFIGFEAIASFELLGPLDNLFINLGINAHYVSLSRGVIDSRDLLYFFGLIALFLLFTKTVLESRRW